MTNIFKLMYVTFPGADDEFKLPNLVLYTLKQSKYLTSDLKLISWLSSRVILHFVIDKINNCVII